MSKEKKTAELKRGEGNFYHCCDYDDAMEIINEQAKEIERLKGNKSGKDKLFDLANEFAGDEFGHIAVKLHAIHNILD